MRVDSVITAGLLIAAACEGNLVGKVILYVLAALSLFAPAVLS